MPSGGTHSERALILAPHGRDAEVAAGLLREAWLPTQSCSDIAHLCRELEQGAGLAIVAEEAVASADLRGLERWVKAQAPWSDLPIVLLTRHGDEPARNPLAQRLQDILGNVSFLERPFHPTTLVSMARSALRMRRRQYRARELLEELRAGEERLRLFIEHAPAALVMLDRDMRYLALSRRWIRDFNLSGTLIGRSHYEVFPEIPEAWRQGHQRCLAGATENSDAELFHRADGTSIWLKRQVRPWRDNQGNIGGLVISWEDITEQKQAEERQRLLSQELQHRTKNLIAVIQSIAMGSFQAGDKRRDAFRDRLQALAHAQDLLTDSKWGSALMEDIVRRELHSFSDRISIEGPRVLLRPSAAQGFALVVHELATNAAKHGAFKAAGGKVSVSWSVEDNATDPALLFRWQERGGPTVTRPKQRGFGSVLLENAVSSSEGPPRLEYAPDGFTYELKASFAISPAQGTDHQLPQTH
jgi:PAS domain S-box-containing protein